MDYQFPSTSFNNNFVAQLPNELILKILEYLNYSELAKLKLTSQKFYSIICHNSARLNRPKLDSLCLSLVKNLDPNFGRFVSPSTSKLTKKENNKTKLNIHMCKKFHDYKFLRGMCVYFKFIFSI